MHDFLPEVQAIDDVLRAIAPVLVEVEDADLVRLALGQENGRRDHQPVEGAVPAGKVVAGMMETGAGRNRADLIFQRFARGREHGAAGQRQAGGHGPRAVAEAVPAAAGKDVGDELRVVGDAELLGAERLRGVKLKR